jgi:hypothetical protein
VAWNAGREDAWDRGFALYAPQRDALKALRERFLTCQQAYLGDLRHMVAEADRLSGVMVKVKMEVIDCAPHTEYVHNMGLLLTRVYALRRRMDLALAAHDCDREEKV